MYAVREINADGTSNGYTTKSPLSKDEAKAEAKQQREWNKECGGDKKYRIVKVHLTFS